MKCCIVVGSSGQDGSTLFDRLSAEGHRVIGIASGGTRTSDSTYAAAVDILDSAAVDQLVSSVSPDEVYYVAAFHHAAEQKLVDPGSLIQRSVAIQVSGAVNFLEAIRKKSPKTRLFYASTARIFGSPQVVPQDETTPVNPDCVYGISKAAGQSCVRYYRQEHSLFAASGILYNHESPLRKPSFVSQKIARGAVAIKLGLQSRLVLGDLDTVVDWGYAPDYVDAMVRILALNAPDDYVIATGEPHTVRDFVKTAFDAVGIDWKTHVNVSPGLLWRQPRTLVGRPAKLSAATGWKPAVSFAEMVRILVQAEEARNAQS